jgi:hypothetical protein
MRRLATFTLAVCLFVPSLLAATLDGAWTASLDEKKPDHIYVSLTRGRSHQTGMTMQISSFAGLTAAQAKSGTTAPVHFELRREAGTAVFDGTFRNGKGAGQFEFTPDRSYIAAVQSLGIEFKLDDHRKGRSDDEDLFSLALCDVSTAFIRSMIAEGYKVRLEDYLELRIFEVTPEYIREMRTLGFRDITAEDLVASRIHGVTPAYLREVRAAGWTTATLEDLQSTRIHGATPAFAAEMKKLGYGDLSLDDLIAFRIHGVTPRFIEDLRAVGYTNVSADDLVDMRIHGVTTAFIRELEAAGYVKIPVEKLVEMRIQGVDARYIKAMKQ